VADERSILDTLPEAVVVIDDGGRVALVNDRAAPLLGIGPDAIGRRLEEVVDLRDDSGEACRLPTSAPSVGDRLAERVLHVVRGGRRRPVAISGRWADDQLVLTVRSAGRRERLDAVRGDVVATVSHEIRSPLTSVKGFTRTLLARWDRFSDEQKRAMLETIDADADRVTRLLKELLDVSRIDAGRVELHRTRVDVLRLTRGVVDRARRLDPGGEHRVEVIADDDLPPLLADADKLEQVLTNLIENALSYADGPVEVRLVLEEDGDLHLTVADRGPGIPEDQHQVVFQKFGRGRGVRRAGTGLGLYITRGLVEAHGGRVWIDPTVDAGAHFHVRFPAHRVA
jgi:signal transduction histidine kinase